MEIRNSKIIHGLEELSAQLTIWTSKIQENQRKSTPRLIRRPQRGSENKSVVFVRKKSMFLQDTDICSHTGAATAAAIEYRICSCSTQPLPRPGFDTGWLMVVCVSQELSERNLFYMLRRNVFERQPEKLYTDGFEKLVHRWRRCVEQEEHIWKNEA